ncbi:DUF3892 domain-containing protein [Escherichia coli]|uniref:DUF3892 domain-containing protein n=1 Tax=Escherichia coli TaxID=562 RepID=UPI001BD4A86E|nr:DUF3892 domain-containing protein [Escherichia coli]EEY5976002.1 DUF3892 domain-containing protein [Escherichia coli]EHB7626848.1 DUF3892 domain-containing protein [Escherichia coli]MDN1343061.1 DUF3892 domain-containing protein [Escherichia coli]HDS8798828.1 DUF3892 domain-containing protein [Escherichia coli]
MVDVRLTCITLSSSNALHEHITHVGSPQFNPPGSKWTVADVVNSIENKLHTFYVTDSDGKRADVGVVDPGGGGRKFIRTYADGRWNNNLLSLPRC